MQHSVHTHTGGALTNSTEPIHEPAQRAISEKTSSFKVPTVAEKAQIDSWIKSSDEGDRAKAEQVISLNGFKRSYFKKKGSHLH